MARFIQPILLLLGAIGGSSQVFASRIESIEMPGVTPINSVTHLFPIQIALYDPSHELLANDSVTTPMLAAALASLFCSKRLDLIVVTEAYANTCPENKDRLPLSQSFVLRPFGRYGADIGNNGKLTWLIWSIGFSLLQIPEFYIDQALQNGNNHMNRTLAGLEVAQNLQDALQDMVDYACLDSSFDDLLHENAVERNYRMYCSPLDIPDYVLER